VFTNHILRWRAGHGTPFGLELIFVAHFGGSVSELGVGLFLVWAGFRGASSEWQRHPPAPGPFKKT